MVVVAPHQLVHVRQEVGRRNRGRQQFVRGLLRLVPVATDDETLSLCHRRMASQGDEAVAGALPKVGDVAKMLATRHGLRQGRAETRAGADGSEGSIPRRRPVSELFVA